MNRFKFLNTFKVTEKLQRSYREIYYIPFTQLSPMLTFYMAQGFIKPKKIIGIILLHTDTLFGVLYFK